MISNIIFSATGRQIVWEKRGTALYKVQSTTMKYGDDVIFIDIETMMDGVGNLHT